MTFAPEHMGRFQFVRLSTLRAAQLMCGCTPRVNAAHKPTTTAQQEVLQGKVCGVSHVITSGGTFDEPPHR